MGRRKLFKTSIWLGFGLLIIGQASAKKNILLLMADDMNDWVGAFEGHPQANTPNMDKLAKKGIVFRNAQCASPVCQPSRTALMTGLHGITTGITANYPDSAEGDFRNRNYPTGGSMKNHVTLSQYFMNNGYTAIGSGKIFHRPKDEPQSWNIMYPGGVGGGGPGNDGIKSLEWGASDKTTDTYPDMMMVKWSAKKLDSNFTKPFFLTAGVFRPHLSWYIPKEFYDRRIPAKDIILPPILKNDIDDIPNYMKGHQFANGMWEEMQAHVKSTGNLLKPQEAVSAYLAAINFADHTLGVILTALEQSKYADSTIVVLMGDHGWHLGEKNRYSKISLWDESTRTPLIIYDPQYKNGGGRNIWDVVSLTDVYPTLLDLAGLPPNKLNEGQSLAHFVRNTPSSFQGWALTSHKAHHALTTNNYKLIRSEDGTFELYNRKNDPNEWTNLAFKLPADSPMQDTIKMLASDLTRILNHQAPEHLAKFSPAPVTRISRRDVLASPGFNSPSVPKAYNLKGEEQQISGGQASGVSIYRELKKTAK